LGLTSTVRELKETLLASQQVDLLVTDNRIYPLARQLYNQVLVFSHAYNANLKFNRIQANSLQNYVDKLSDHIITENWDIASINPENHNPNYALFGLASVELLAQVLGQWMEFLGMKPKPSDFERILSAFFSSN
jgi:hypothetical protein